MNADNANNLSFNVRQLAAVAGGNFTGSGETKIFRVASLETAGENEIAFADKNELAQLTNAACLIVAEDFSSETDCPQIKVKNPKLAFAKIAAVLHPIERRSGWHATAVVSENSDVRAQFIGAFVTIGENSQIGEGVQIFDGARIGNNVSIGENTIVRENCVVYDNVSIGRHCTIHAGAILGADGFGFVRDGANGYVKFPQIGALIIDDEVEIGANSCIDRGALGATKIGKGTKIDNLVQIAHNVQIGARVVIASQTGISGSTIIEDDCVIGGQVGFGDHARVLTGAIIGSKAGILPGKIVRAGVWWGIPVQPLDEYKRQNAIVKSLPRLREEIKILKKEIELLKADKDSV